MEALVTKLQTIQGLVQELEEPPPDITVVKEYPSSYIDGCLAGLNVFRLPLDGKYRLTDQRNFLNIVAWDWIDEKPYVAEVYDCENFAISFKAHVDFYFGLNQVGIVVDYVSGHAYNLIVFPGSVVMLFEPQEDSLIMLPKRDKRRYALTESIILI